MYIISTTFAALLICGLLSAAVSAQNDQPGSDASDLLAVTDDGRVVILADDGGHVNTLEEQPWYGGEVGAA